MTWTRAVCSVGVEKEKSARAPKGHWESFENRRKFILELGERLGVKEKGEWAGVTVRQVRREGGSGVLRHYNYSLGRALDDLLVASKEDFAIDGDRKEGERSEPGKMRSRVPHGYWEVIGNRKEFLLKVASNVGIDTRHKESWKLLTSKVLEERGGMHLLNKYQGSVLQLLAATFPEEEWKAEECRAVVPNRYWHEAENRKRFLDGITEEFNVTEQSNWAHITNAVIKSKGGSGLLGHFSGSLFDALRVTYPEEDWREEECRPTLSAKHWEKRENCRRVLDAVKRKRRIREPSEWRNVSDQDLIDEGGQGMLRTHGGVWNALKYCYGHEEPFFCHPRNEIFARGRVRAELWEDLESVRLFLRKAKKELQIESNEEWQRVSKEQICAIGGRGLLKRYGLLSALRLSYPEERWEEWGKGSQAGKKASQRLLLLQVRSLAPRARILEDYLHPHLGPARGAAEQ